MPPTGSVGLPQVYPCNSTITAAEVFPHLDKPKSNSFQKNENSDKCPELNKECTGLPKSIPSCSYFKKEHLI
jgi:hypothetical protein